MEFAGITKLSEVGHEVCTKHTHLMQTGTVSIVPALAPDFKAAHA